LWANWTGNGGDLKSLSIHGELPIVTPATPAISYVSNRTMNSDFFMIVRGYRDIFSPRI